MPPRIDTRLTRLVGIDHPVLLAPMDKVSGGRLAAAVSAAGRLGLIGGGYGDPDWLDAAFDAAGNQPVGVGFITWRLAERPDLLPRVMARGPRAVMFSFGDAAPFVETAKAAGAVAICQVQRLEQARAALAAGADVIVAQGQEAGGHGMDRGLFTLLPAVRDLAGPERVVLAAGGIADGRGLAAALALGADGVLVGTRFWASEEADGPDAAKAVIAAAEGDRTLRTKVFDAARGVAWPWQYTGRVVANAFAETWHGRIASPADAAAAPGEAARAAYAAAAEDDFSTKVVIAGEAVDLIDKVEPAAAIVERMVAEAATILEAGPRLLVP